MKRTVLYVSLLVAFSNVLFGQSNSSPNSPDSSIRFLKATNLIKTIRAAPEENRGQPGLYSLRLSPETEYPVIGIRRTKPAKSELHNNFSDVWYVVHGSAMLITGGTLVAGADTGGGEIRGTSISGGTARVVKAGDYAFIPAGTPHWVSKVVGTEILYVVTKIPSPAK